VIDSTLLSMNYIIRTVTHDLTSARGADDLSEEDTETFEGMIADCGNIANRIQSANDRLKVQYDLCRLHDKAVADRWSSLTTRNDAHGQLLDAFGGAMRAFSTELEDRPTQEIVQTMIDQSVASAKKGLEESLTGTINKLMLKMKIKMVEQETLNEMHRQANGGNTDSNEEAAEKFEGMLEPLISDIVEMYVHRASTPAADDSRDRDQDGGKTSDGRSRQHRLDADDEQGPGGRRNRLQARKQQEELLKTMKEELALHTVKIDEILQKKNDLTEVQNLLSTKADAYELSTKADSRVMETVEKTLRKVMEDLGDLRNLKDSELEKVKGTLEKHVKAKLITLFSKMEDNAKPAFLSTKSLCLSCARVSSVKVHSEPTSAPGFLPALGAVSTPGPDVYRGGFRMPVSSRDGLFTSKSQAALPEELMGMDMDLDDLRVISSAKPEGQPAALPRKLT